MWKGVCWILEAAGVEERDGEKLDVGQQWEENVFQGEMMDWTEPVSGNNNNNNNVEPSHTDGGRRRSESPERDASSVAFSDPSSLVTCPFSCFPSCLVARVHWAEIQSLLCDWLAWGYLWLLLLSFFFLFLRDIEVTFWYWFLASPEKKLPPFFFYQQRCPCSVVLHSVTSCLLPVHLLAPNTKSVQEFWLFIWYITHFTFEFQASHHHPSNLSLHIGWVQFPTVLWDQAESAA